MKKQKHVEESIKSVGGNMSESMRGLLNIYLHLTYTLMYYLGGVFCIISGIKGGMAETQELEDAYFMAGFGFLGFHLLSFYFASKITVEKDGKPIDKTD